MKKITFKSSLLYVMILLFILTSLFLFIPKGEVSYATDLSGTGTSTDPYLIGTASDLALITENDGVDVYFEQNADISLTESFSLETFYGHYDGNDYSLIYTGDLSTPGFCEKNYGYINYLTIQFNDVTMSRFFYAGGIVGQNYGTIYEVDVEGTLSTTTLIGIFGGISATNETGAVICGANVDLKCYLDTYVSGGIAGSNYGEMGWCTSTILFIHDSIADNACFGGLVGNNDENAVCQYNTTDEFILCFSGDADDSATPYVGGYIGKDEGNDVIAARNTINDFYGISATFTLSDTNYTYVNSTIGLNSDN
jgi:hypothetical protein